MTEDKELTQVDKFVIIILFVSAPILFVSGTSLVTLGILVFILDWATTLVGIGLIIFGLILLVGFIFSVYLPRKRLKERREELTEEEREKVEDSIKPENSESSSLD